MIGEKPLTGDRDGVLHDLIDEGLLDLKEGERLWKVNLFRPASGRATRLEHRIYTKIKAGGRLALVTFAVHVPPGGQEARSKIARVPDLSPADLDRIIESIRTQTKTGPEEYEEIDLRGIQTIEEQLEYLRD